MATGTFYLRPSADVSFGEIDPNDVDFTMDMGDWKKYPSDLAAYYLAVNEETCDEDATYLEMSATSVDSVHYYNNVTFLLDGNVPTGKFKVDSVVIKVWGYIGEETSSGFATFWALYDDNVMRLGSSMSFGGTPGFREITLYDLAGAINDYIELNGSMPNLKLKMNMDTTAGSSKAPKDALFRVSQVFLEIEYTTGYSINHKVNGEWKATTAAYQKQNGAWVEITEDECKSILSGSFITK